MIIARTRTTIEGPPSPPNVVLYPLRGVGHAGRLTATSYWHPCDDCAHGARSTSGRSGWPTVDDLRLGDGAFVHLHELGRDHVGIKGAAPGRRAVDSEEADPHATPGKVLGQSQGHRPHRRLAGA